MQTKDYVTISPPWQPQIVNRCLLQVLELGPIGGLFCGDPLACFPPIHQPKFSSTWLFPKIGGKPPKWMVKIMENPIKMDDLGVPLFLDIFGNIHICAINFNPVLARRRLDDHVCCDHAANATFLLEPRTFRSWLIVGTSATNGRKKVKGTINNIL